MAETQKVPSGRTKRTPLGYRNKLSVAGKDANYHYRFVNDEDDRVQDFIGAGYEIVKNADVKIGDNRVETSKGEGSDAMISVGGGTKAYLMRIKKEWYEEDQEAKLEEAKKREQAIKQPNIEGAYGSIKLER